MNFRIRLGEIDIIAIHKKTLCFVEVKTRTSNAFGTPLESISKRKQRKLTMTALAYISARKITETNMRFDIVTVMPDSSGGYECELYQNAFECDNV